MFSYTKEYNSSSSLPVSVITEEHHHRPVQVAARVKLSEKLRVKLVHRPGEWRIPVSNGNYHMEQKLGLATQSIHKAPADVQVQVGDRLRIQTTFALIPFGAPRVHFEPKWVIVEVDRFSGETSGIEVEQTQPLQVFVEASDVVLARKLAPNQRQVVKLRLGHVFELTGHVVVRFRHASQTGQQRHQVGIAVFADFCELYKIIKYVTNTINKKLRSFYGDEHTCKRV